ncbi:hypothetical protein EV207_15512 [Scopulibacillus darangshiensis]|uniref:Membrane protein YdfK n=1 Tax=Scopulibacillus darangshiensis TaxID=442528 RepID=A0A4R2NFA4_9BACL|nr:DUF554 domain-containing protein [Scopulibacillus darangshiensis]TCP20019.1 hypothetical protein EV207_15512 [Scopulibacillus darangshiensis]
MVLLGTIVNTLAIMIGSILGNLFTKIPDRIKHTVTHGMALVVVVLGLQMGLKSDQFLIVIGSLALGAVIGEGFELEEKLNRLGRFLERKVGNRGEGNIASAFVTGTLVFVVGALAIVGALDSGLRDDHSVLFTKAMLDGFFALIFSTTLGIGVIFSAIPVFLYEGAIALLATKIETFVPQPLMAQLINELTATGGLLIVAIGLNLLNITKIRTANLLPSIVICILIVTGIFYLKPLI